MKCPKSGICINNDWVGWVWQSSFEWNCYLQCNYVNSEGTVEIFFRQRWLSPPPPQEEIGKFAPYAYVIIQQFILILCRCHHYCSECVHTLGNESSRHFWIKRIKTSFTAFSKVVFHAEYEYVVQTDLFCLLHLTFEVSISNHFGTLFTFLVKYQKNVPTDLWLRFLTYEGKIEMSKQYILFSSKNYRYPFTEQESLANAKVSVQQRCWPKTDFDMK